MSVALSISGGKVEEEIVEGLKRKIEEVAQEKNELNTKLLKLEGDLLEKKKVMKAMKRHVE